LFFRAPPEAYTVGLLALAFGDSAAGFVGRLWGRLRPHWLHGKSIEGSIACFIAIFVVAKLSSEVHQRMSLVAAVVGCLIEALPLEDFDNILIPLGVASAMILY
jgi:dolichol kinase